MQHGPSVIIRASGIYGTHRFTMLDQLKNKQLNYSQVPQISNRIHVLDCAQALLHIMLLKEREPMYILTDSEPTPTNTIHAWLSATIGIPIEHNTKDNEQSPPPESTAHKRSKHRYISNAKLLESGFKFNYPSFKQGIKAILIEKGEIPEPF